MGTMENSGDSDVDSSSLEMEAFLQDRLGVFDETPVKPDDAVVDTPDDSSDSSASLPPARPTPPLHTPTTLPAAPRKRGMYNPLSNYSPDRPLRRQIMGMSVVTYQQPSPRPMPQDDLSSVDSVELLERKASQLREELRHAEMVEVALAAERAAEAGQERFAGQPITYGNERTLLQRHVTYSEGTRIPARSLRKVIVTDLRKVDEVIPSYQDFHKHLRTHLARHRTGEDGLFFRETTWKANQRNFLPSFRFDPWADIMGSTRVENRAAVSVGDVVASHTVSRRKRIRKIDVPPGLEEDFAFLNKTNVSKSSIAETETETVSDQASEGAHSSHAIAPRALFDHEEDLLSKDGMEDSVIVETLSPIREQDPVAMDMTHMFVTPARLRDIREIQQSNLPGADSMILVEPSSSHLDTGIPVVASKIAGVRKVKSSLLMPDSFNDETGRGETGKSVSIHHRRSTESGLDALSAELGLSESTNETSVAMSIPSSLSMPLPARQEMTHPSSDDAPNTVESPRAIHTIMDLAMDVPVTPIADSALMDSRRKRSDKKVKVSIYAKSPDRSMEYDYPDALMLQEETILVQQDSNDKNDSVQTPQPCNCLSNLSPASSLDSNDIVEKSKSEEAAAKEAEGESPMRRSISMGDFAVEEKEWNPFTKSWTCEDTSHKPLQAAMEMLSLSPRDSPKQNRGSLFLPASENDDFLNNYLYLSKNPEPLKDRICSEPCIDSTFPCAAIVDFTTDPCCGAMFMGDQEPSSHLQWNRSGRIEPEAWFDVANERFDSVVEHILGTSSSRRGSKQWKAPSLKKCSPKERSNSFVDDPRNVEESPILDEKKEDRVESETAVSLHRKQPPATYFELAYGMSREAFGNLTARERFLLDEKVKQKHASLHDMMYQIVEKESHKDPAEDVLVLTQSV